MLLKTEGYYSFNNCKKSIKFRSEIMSKYLGESEHKIRKLFAQARKLTPCILFFDELDSIGTKRSKLIIL